MTRQELIAIQDRAAALANFTSAAEILRDLRPGQRDGVKKICQEIESLCHEVVTMTKTLITDGVHVTIRQGDWERLRDFREGRADVVSVEGVKVLLRLGKVRIEP